MTEADGVLERGSERHALFKVLLAFCAAVSRYVRAEAGKEPHEQGGELSGL